MAAKVARSWRGLLARPKEKLQFTTVIIGVLRVKEPATSDHAEDVEAVRSMLTEYQDQWTAMLRSRALPRLVWRGAFELALVRAAPAGSHRHALFDDLGTDMSDLAADERYVVVHVHGVVDLGDNTADQLRACLQERWPGRWRIQVKGLYTHQTVPEALSELSSYCYKHRLKYSDGGLDDEQVKYTSPYELPWSRYINALYRGFDRPWRSKR